MARDLTCEKCEIEYSHKCNHRKPRLLDGNSAVWELVHFSPSVWKDSINGIIGFDYIQIKALAGILGIHLDRMTMEKISLFEDTRLKEKKDNA